MITQRVLSERAIILAPHDQESDVALTLLEQAGFTALIAPDLAGLIAELAAGAGLAIIADEALYGINIHTLLALMDRQPSWSDMPIVLLTHPGGPEHNPSLQLGAIWATSLSLNALSTRRRW